MHHPLGRMCGLSSRAGVELACDPFGVNIQSMMASTNGAPMIHTGSHAPMLSKFMSFSFTID
jgi:hypothetical protein